MFLFDSKRGRGACQRSVIAHDGILTEMAAASASLFATKDEIRPQEFAPACRRWRARTVEAHENKRVRPWFSFTTRGLTPCKTRQRRTPTRTAAR
jgi:hypothetical protein